MFRALKRVFAERQKGKIPKLNQPETVEPPGYNFKVLTGIAFGVVLFKVVFHEIRVRTVMHRIEGYEPKPQKFSGILRPGFNSEMEKELQKQTVFLYGNKNSGKTQALRGFCSEQTHCLMIETNGKWSEELNKLGIPVKFSFFDFRLMLTLMGRLCEKFPGLIVILDGFENLNFSEKKYLSRLIRSQAGRPGRFIISTNEFDYLSELKNTITGQVLCLKEMNKAEMHKAMQELSGYKFEDVETLWDKCEGGLEFALDMIHSGKSAEKYLSEKKELVLKHVREISKEPEEKLRIINALLSKKEAKPLGELYKTSEIAKVLNERGLLKYQDGDSLSFRNKFVYDTILEEVKQIKAEPHSNQS